MDLDDSFTRNLVHRTMARREEINRKLGLTPEPSLSTTKRRRTPLAEENAVIEDNESLERREDSDSPKRQRFSEEGSLEALAPSPVISAKENSPVPVLGLKGLAALKRRNQENAAESSINFSGRLSKHEHEESQGFMKSPSTRKLTYAYPEGEQEPQSSVRDRLKMFENAEPPSTGSDGASVKPHSKTVPAFKKPPIMPAKKTSLQHLPPAVCVTENDESSSQPDPADLSMASKRALFEAPLLMTDIPDKQSPEKLSVSQRTALFERAMVSPAPKSNRTRCPSPRREVGKIFPPSTSPSPAKPSVQQSPVKPNISASPAKPSIHISPAKPSVHVSPAKPSVEASPAESSDQDSPFKPSVQDPPVTPLVQASPAKNLVKPSPVKPSNSILRKAEGQSTDASCVKTVRFGRSPSKCDSPPVASTHTGPNILEVPRSPRLGSHTQEIQQRLLGGLKKSTSTSRMVDKTIAERKREMERLLFNKHTAEEEDKEDSLLSQEDDSDASHIQQTETNISDETASSEMSSQLEEEQDKHYTENSSDNFEYPSSSALSDGREEVSDALDDELQSLSEEEMEEEEEQHRTPQPVPSPKKQFVSSSSEAGTTPLMHSVSVYRRQKQALCTPPVRVIQRKPLVDSPPSPPPVQEDPRAIEVIHARIQYLQECLHCQNVQVRQASQALYLCSAKPELFGSPEHIEGERLLLIACQKRNAYRNTLERLKTEAALGRPSNQGSVMGTLTMSDIRLPLKHDFLSSQLAGIGGDAVHFFFCLIRYQDKVITTEMLSTRGSDITAGTLSFTNHICIQELENNFQVHFEVYALQASAENLANHERKHSLKREHGKAKVKKLESKAKLSPALSSPMPGQNERTSNFGLIGFTQFTVDNCSQKVMVLEKVPSCSPLDSRMYIKLQLCTQQPVKEQGFLTMFEDVSGFGAWHRRWVVLNGSHLSFWKYPDQVHTEIPIGSIDLRTCVTPEVGLVSADVCARKNTFMLFCVRPKSREDRDTLVNHSHSNQMTTKYLISADTKEERVLWCQQLNAALQIIRRWDPQALKPSDYPLQC